MRENLRTSWRQSGQKQDHCPPLLNHNAKYKRLLPPCCDFANGVRRFVVFDVAEHRKQDPAWFDPLYAELENGGLEAMFHDLLELDLDGWHPRTIVRTEALRQQQLRSLPPEDEWWVELLETGMLQGAESSDPSCARSDQLYDQARKLSPRLRLRAFSVNSGSASRLYLGPQPSHSADEPAASPHEV